MPNSWLKGRQEQRQNKHTKRKHTTHTSGTTEPSQLTASRRGHVKDGLNTEKKTKNDLFTGASAEQGRAWIKYGRFVSINCFLRDGEEVGLV